MSENEPRRIRVGNSERENAVAELGEHLSAGRIDAHEYADRAATAYSARTSDELDRLFEDLPRPGALEKSAPYPVPVDAPYGIEPRSGMPYSDRHKVLAGVLQLVLPFLGAGRFYTGHYGMAIAQLLLTFVGVGVVWAFIDGIVILAGRPTDPYSRPLRP